MADSYIIDGYNLIHALGMIHKNMAAGGLEESRRQLLAFLAQAFAADSPRVTVVFDAKQAPRGVARRQEHLGLQIHFAPKNQSADDWIETLVEQAPEPRFLVVVSNDNRLQAFAKQHGGRGWTHDALLDFLDRKQKTPSAEERIAEVPETAMSPEELARWMKEFQALESDPELKEFFDLDRFD